MDCCLCRCICDNLILFSYRPLSSFEMLNLSENRCKYSDFSACPQIFYRALSCKKAAFKAAFFAERQGFFVRFATKALRDNEPEGSHSAFHTIIGCKLLTYSLLSAERQGFEPWVPVRVQRFSRPSRSTAPASFHWCVGAVCKCKGTTFSG